VITVKFFKQRIIVQLQLYGIIIIGVNPLYKCLLFHVAKRVMASA
jgi:hypothetical protein